jgi:outer membrane protein assembly factor BamA
MRTWFGINRPSCRARGRWGIVSVLLLWSVATAGIDLEIHGNSYVSERRIKEGISSEPENFKKDGLLTWQEDAQFFVSDLYRRNGYFDAQVDVQVQPRKGGGKEDWNAVMTIREGERYRFDTVQVVIVPSKSGATPPQDSAASRAIHPAAAKSSVTQLDPTGVDSLAPSATPLGLPSPVRIDSSDFKAQSGKPYQENMVFEDRRFLLQRFGNSGYVHAKVDDKVWVKAPTHTVKVDYLVEPAYPVLFDTLFIRDQRAWPADSLGGITQERLLRSLVKVKKGDTVRISESDRWIEKLQYTGAFNYVRLRDTLLPGPAHASGLTLQLEERVPGNIRTSTFYETYSGFGVSVDARHSNVAGSLTELRGGLVLASQRQNLYLGYGSPLLFGYLIRFDDDLGVNWTQDKSVAADAGTFGGDFQALNSARLTWPWSNWLRLVGDAELESKSRMLSLDSRERSLNLNFIQTAYFSFLNQALDPSRGVRFAPSWGNGGPFLEDRKFRFTEFRHNWLEMQSGYYYYYPSLHQIKLAIRLDGGRFFGEGGTNSDRFFLGGGRSVRSYGFQDLCPETERDSLGHTVCSTKNQTLAYVLTSYELRIAPFAFGMVPNTGLWKQLIPLEFVPFYDFGKVWNLQKGFALSGGEGSAHQPHGQGVAVGLGLRYPLLGIFNFRLDLAYNGKHDNGNWPDAWVVDLAQAF